MSRSSLRWCLAAGAILALLTSLPFLFAFERQGDDLRFTGSLLAVEDGNSYIAKMRQGAEGDWLFRSPYTAIPQSGVPVFLTYILLGKLAQGPDVHTQLVAILHTARVLAILAVVLATYRFAARFVDDEWWRRWATVLAVAGGGLGWLILALGRADWLGSQPLELYSPETFGFLAMLTFPHLLLARALLLLGLEAYLASALGSRAAWRAGVWLGLLVLVQPISIAAAGAAIAMHQVVLLLRTARARNDVALDWRVVRAGATALALPLVLLGGYALLLRTDEFLRAWAAQNVLRSPHPLHYLLAYGVLLPLVVLGALRAPEDRRVAVLLLVGWVLALPALAYAPTDVQRRLPEGGWVALVILAALGLARLGNRERSRRRLALTVMSACLVGSLVLLAGAFQSALSGRMPAYRQAQEVAAFEGLDDVARPGAVVLSTYATGNALPAWADVHVVIGHGPESAGLAVLQPRVEAYYRDSGASAEAYALLVDLRVEYVFVGPPERALGFSETRAPDSLRAVYSEGNFVVFEVVAAAQSGAPAARVAGQPRGLSLEAEPPE